MNILKSFNRELQESITAEPEPKRVTVLNPLTIDEQYTLISNTLEYLEKNATDDGYHNFVSKSVIATRLNGHGFMVEFCETHRTDIKTAIQNAGNTLYELIARRDTIGKLTAFKSPYWPIIQVMCAGDAVADIGKLKQAFDRARDRYNNRKQFWSIAWKGIGALGMQMGAIAQKALPAVGVLIGRALSLLWDYWFVIALLLGVCGAGILISADWEFQEGRGSICAAVFLAIGALIYMASMSVGGQLEDDSKWKDRSRFPMNVVSTILVGIWIVLSWYMVGTMNTSYTHPPFVYERSTGKYVGRAVQSEKNNGGWHITGINDTWVDMIKYKVRSGFLVADTLTLATDDRIGGKLEVAYSIDEKFMANNTKDFGHLDPKSDIQKALQGPLTGYVGHYLNEASKRVYVTTIRVHGIDLWNEGTKEITLQRDTEQKIFMEGAMRTITSVKLPEPWTNVASLSIKGFAI